MRTDTRPTTPPASNGYGASAGFVLRLMAWSLALFGMFRLPWITGQLLLPMTRLQAAGGTALFGPSTLPIEVTLACSGADAVALCLAAILAYPVRWRIRAAGAAAGLALILALNTIRIGTLGRAVASPRWFEALHVYVWPAVLTLAIGAFIVGWMRVADRRQASDETQTPPEHARRDVASFSSLVTLRFALVAAVFLLIFTLAGPLYLESPRVLAAAALVARAAAMLLRGAGVSATANAGVLTTTGGAFLVTQECISTPLMPVYLAAIAVYTRNWRQAALWTAAAVPLFAAVGIARLLMVAVPAGIGTPPAFLIHAFSQLLVAAGMVGALAYWRHGAGAAAYVRTALALTAALAFVSWFGAPYTRAIVSIAGAAAPFDDAQGALMFLPAFQAGLFLALWIAAFTASGWRRLLCGAACMVVVQIAVAGGVPWVASHAGLVPLVRDVRAWALLGPALIIAAVVNIAAPHR